MHMRIVVERRRGSAGHVSMHEPGAAAFSCVLPLHSPGQKQPVYSCENALLIKGQSKEGE